MGFVCKEFENGGCCLLEDYRDSTTPMKYRCECGGISRISWNNFKRGKRCRQCAIIKISGKNNYQWVQDREFMIQRNKFRNKCCKLVSIVLNCVGQKKERPVYEILGYNSDELMEHIVSHDNWRKIKGHWHVDHVYPIKAFLDYGIDDVSLINCLENLQPLPAAQNLKKGAKYDKKLFENWLKNNGVQYEASCNGI